MFALVNGENARTSGEEIDWIRAKKAPSGTAEGARALLVYGLGPEARRDEPRAAMSKAVNGKGGRGVRRTQEKRRIRRGAAAANTHKYTLNTTDTILYERIYKMPTAYYQIAYALSKGDFLCSPGRQPSKCPYEQRLHSYF